MTKELARAIEQVDVDYTTSRLAGMQVAAGNPLGIEIRRFGNATAFSIRAWPDFWYGNKVLGLEPTSEKYLDEMVSFFRQQGLSFRFELVPGNLNGELAARLHRLGFYQVGFSTALYGKQVASGQVARLWRGFGRAQSRPQSSRGQVSVREVQADELDLFLDLYQEGFGLARLSEAEKGIVRAWLEQESGLYLCMAFAGDEPAGVGILYVQESKALLADAATLPGLRGQGCHTALIRHRVSQAAKRGCDLLTSFVEFGSASHRNLERAGLRVAYTKAMWISR
jgi:GNAT superfamily N-acetyltransferase